MHLLQGIVMIGLSHHTTYPIYTDYLTFHVTGRGLVTHPKPVHDLRCAASVSVFLRISAVARIDPWRAIVLHCAGALSSVGGKPSTFVYPILPTIPVFFNIFALYMVLAYTRVVSWKDYLFGERVYIILSLLAKTTSAWMIFVGDAFPSLGHTRYRRRTHPRRMLWRGCRGFP